MKTVKSINVNTIFDKKTTKDNIGKPLVRVAGDVHDIIIVNSKFGDSVGFKGFFTAVNLLTGEIFESNAAFIPTQLTASLKEKLSNGNIVFVEFDLVAMVSEKSPTGYAWVAEQPQTEEMKRKVDIMREQAAKFASSLNLLEASKKSKK